MGFMDQVWATVLGAAIFGVLGWAVAGAYTWAQRKVGRSPDFVMRLQPTGVITIERARRRTAFEVRMQLMGENGEVANNGVYIHPDLAKGGQQDIFSALPVNYLNITWIDGERLAIQTVPPKEPGIDVPLTAKRQRARLRLTRS